MSASFEFVFILVQAAVSGENLSDGGFGEGDSCGKHQLGVSCWTLGGGGEWNTSPRLLHHVHQPNHPTHPCHFAKEGTFGRMPHLCECRCHQCRTSSFHAPWCWKAQAPVQQSQSSAILEALELGDQCPVSNQNNIFDPDIFGPFFWMFFFSVQVWDMMLNTWSCWTLNCVRCIVYGMNL